MISLGILYQINFVDLTEAEINDPLWSDMPQELPDGKYMLIREIKKAKDGEDFKYFPSGERRQKEAVQIDSDAFSYYMSVHQFTEEFGLPHGKGWIHELPWVPHFLLYMADLKKLVQAWVNAKGMKSGGGSPSDFMS